MINKLTGFNVKIIIQNIYQNNEKTCQIKL